MPPATYRAFRDHGTVAPTLAADTATARTQLETLADLGIDLEAVTDRLEAEGVKAFSDAFDNLISAIESKTTALTATA